MKEKKNFCLLLWNGIFPWLVYIFISCSIGFLLDFIACLFAAKLLPKWYAENYAVLATSISAAAAIPVLFRMYHMDQIKRGTFPSVKKLGGGKRYLLVLGFSACIAGNNLIKISQIGNLFPGYQEVAASIDYSQLWLNLLGVGILVPVAEELVFRAMLFGRFRDRYSFWTAAFVSSAAFAVFHGNMVQGIYAAVSGMILAYGYEQCNSFLAPVLLHSSMNLTSILFNKVIPEYPFMQPGAVFYSGTLAAIISCVYCMIHLKNGKLTDSSHRLFDCFNSFIR